MLVWLKRYVAVGAATAVGTAAVNFRTPKYHMFTDGGWEYCVTKRSIPKIMVKGVVAGVLWPVVPYYSYNHPKKFMHLHTKLHRPTIDETV